MSTRLNFHPPQNEDEFERMCLQLLRVHWNCPALELYERRGNKQYGIDILDTGGSVPLRVAQCKCYDPKKTLPPSEIKQEVNKAKTFVEPVGLYAILTTAKVSGEAQQTIRKLNIEHSRSNLFQIELYTWDRIKELLNQHRELADEIYNFGLSGQFKTLLKRVSAVGIAVQSFREEHGGGSFHAEIDSARQYINQHDYQMGRLILQRLKNHHWDKLDARQKFRLLANLGAAYLGEGELEKAAQLFWEAKPHQPDDEKACANEALGFQLTKNFEKAFEIADKHRTQFPDSARILAIWVRNSPACKSLDELAIEIPETCMVDAELCASLAVKAASENQFDKAEAFARRAISHNHEWSFPRLLLAKMIMRSHLERAREHDAEGASSEERVREAEQLCTEAIHLAHDEKNKHLEAEAYSARALIHEHEGRKKEARSDAYRAYHLDSSDATIVREYALVLQEQGEHDEAVDLMRKVVGAEQVDPMSWYVLGLTLRGRNAAGDAEESAKLFADLAKGKGAFPGGFREHLAEGAVALYCALQRWDDAQAVVESVPAGLISPLVRATLMAIVSWRRKDQQEAFKWADAAIAAWAPYTPPKQRRLLARMLSESGRHSDALEVWQSLTDLSRFDDDAFNFLETARKLGRANVVAEGCRKLRHAGVDNEQVVDLEVSVLERFDTEGAISLLQEFLSKRPDAKVMRLRLSLIGLRMGRDELVCDDPAMLPSIEEVDATTGQAVAQVLKMGSRPNEATEFAYQLVRRYFSEVSAHRAFCLCLHPLGPSPTIEGSDEVKPGFAVCYQEVGEASDSWVVIEDLPNAEISRNEIEPTSHLARQLLGKRVGESVVLAEGLCFQANRRD